MSENSSKTILVVDDEVDLCEILQFDLEDQGYKVFGAHSAPEALAILNKESIDLIVSDIRMPGYDGVYLLGEIRKKHYVLPPVIFVSGFADVTMAEVFHKGVVGFIAKPMALETLIQTVEINLKDWHQRWSDRKLPGALQHFARSFSSLEQAEAEAKILLGSGGLFLRVDEDLPRLGEVVAIKIALQKEGIILEGLAACRWIRNANGPKQPRGAGLEWVQLNSASLAYMVPFIQQQQRPAFIPME